MCSGSRAKHRTSRFLATDKGDPRRAFISALCDASATAATSSCITSSFESSDSQSLLVAAGVSPADRENSTAAPGLASVIRDHVYHPAFGGSSR